MGGDGMEVDGKELALVPATQVQVGDQIFVTGQDVEQSGYLGEVYANVTKVERKKIDAMDGPRDVVVLTVSTQIIVETEGTPPDDQVWVVQ
jgi:hypothetical protein